ncbi:hypothetical protein M8C21_010586 [Ambrosia artemisiifolia]|uniref:Non-specific lipid-transfer protein n=1 Tax=Ambrosia artemisiifolia TaxID=4212 RepID=A0AAD5GYY6_AMBAR|nr:hypothetical protein M8C21_010586 [Ambrosia artemisiifolia]
MVRMMKALFVMVACMVVTTPYTEAAINCRDLVTKLLSCLPYMQNGGNPSLSCCLGVKSINDAAGTAPDRRAACYCMKQASGSEPSINRNNSAILPDKCRISLPYMISPFTECSRVK